MKFLVTILTFFACLQASATNYYFSSTLGQTTNTGLSAASPWPFSKLANLISSSGGIAPGDSVLFRRGDVIYGSFVIGKSGTSGSPIVFGAYGTGAKPIITSLTDLTFTNVGTNLWESQPLTSSDVQMVTSSGVVKAMGRYPNSGYLTFESHLGTTQITDVQLTGTQWTGAELVERSKHWRLDRAKVLSHVNTIINHTGTTSEPDNNYGYFFQNSPKTLDVTGEWFYNTSTKRLLLYSTSAPTNYQAATKDTLVYASGRSNIRFDNLVVKGCNKVAVVISGGAADRFTNCEIGFAGSNGINLVGGNSGVLIDNITVSNCQNNGISMQSAVNAVVRNFTLHRIGIWEGMGQSGDSQHHGIFSSSDNCLFEYFLIRNVGYAGIRIGGNNSTVQYGWVDTFCVVKDDGGGVYMKDLNQTNINRLIKQVYVTNGINSGAGTPKSASSSYDIYLDDNTANVTVEGCTVRGGAGGLFLHGARNIIVRNSTFYDALLEMEPREAPAGLMRNNTFKNNIFFGSTLNQTLYKLYTTTNDINLLGTFDSNFLARPKFEPQGVNGVSSSTAGGVIVVWYNGNQFWYSLGGIGSVAGGWKSKYPPYDRASKRAPKQGNDSIRFYVNTSKVDVTYNLNNYRWLDMRGGAYKTSITLKPYTSVILYRDSIINTTSNRLPTVSLTSPADGTTYEAPASVSVAATASDLDGSVSIVRFFNGPQYLGFDGAAPFTLVLTNLPVGGYNVTAHAIDNSGDSTISSPVNFTVEAANVPPTVNVITDSINYTTPAKVELSANATDGDGSIVSVSFYNATTRLRTETTAPYTYTWLNVPTGEHTVYATAKDDSGDSTTSSAKIIYVSPQRPVDSALSIMINKGDILCNGQTTTVTVDATGGTEPITGTGTNIVTDGTYQYIIEDANGLKDTAVVTVTEPPALTASALSGTITVYQGSTSTTMSQTGGTAPFQYRLTATGIWQLLNVFTGVKAGTYTAYVKDANGCTTSVNFSVTQPTAPTNMFFKNKKKRFQKLMKDLINNVWWANLVSAIPLTALLGIITWFVVDYVKTNKSVLTALKVEQDKIKYNYLNRFENLTSLIHNIEREKLEYRGAQMETLTQIKTFMHEIAEKDFKPDLEKRVSALEQQSKQIIGDANVVKIEGRVEIKEKT